MKCKICDSGRADEIDGLLASGLSLTKIAAKTGFGRVVVWRHGKHGKHSRESETGDATSALRKLLRDHRGLYQKALRAGNLDVAARQLSAISDLELRLTAAQPGAAPDGNLRRHAVVAVREALGYSRAAARSGREAPGFAFVLRYDDSDPKNPDSHSTRRLNEDEFLEHVLKRSGWRASLVTVLSHMLQYGNAPEPVRAAAADFLSTLSEEDRDGHLGELTNASERDGESRESEEAEGGGSAS